MLATGDQHRPALFIGRLIETEHSLEQYPYRGVTPTGAIPDRAATLLIAGQKWPQLPNIIRIQLVHLTDFLNPRLIF